MKNLKYLLISITLLVLFTSVIFGQANYPFRSNPTGASPYLWDTPGNWEYTTDAGVNWLTAAAKPASSNNITVRSGHTMELSTTASCNNLVIESGAFVVGDASASTASPKSFRIYGTSATINGTLGDTLSNARNGVNLECAGVTGTKLTIEGSGTMSIARARMYIVNDTLVFNMNSKLWYAGGSGTGGYALQGYKDPATYVIPAGRTLTFAKNAGMGTGSGGSANAFTTTFDVYGAIVLDSNCNANLKTSSSKTARLNVYNGGSVIVGGDISATTLGDGGNPTVINIDGTGSLTCNGTVDFNHPSMVVTGTGAFNLNSGATLNIAHAQGITLSGATGLLQTSIRTFNPNARYAYVDTSASQVTGNGLPSTVQRLTINNKKGVTLSSSTTVDTTLTLTRGQLSLGSNNLVVSSHGSISNASDSGYIVTDGSGVLTRNGVGAGDSLFAVGTSECYNPIKINNAGTVDNFSVRVKNSLDNTPPNPNKIVNRQWTITEAVAGGSNATLKMQWNTGDQASQFDPNASVVISRYTGSAWKDTAALVTGSGPFIAAASGFTTFSNFIIQNGTPPSFYPNISNLYFGGVNISTPKVDSVIVKDGGQDTLRITAVGSDNVNFTFSPSSGKVGKGDSIKFYITFTPSLAGYEKGNIVFTNNAVSSPDTVLVSGVGLASGAKFSVDSTSMHFGDVAVGKLNQDSVTVMNIGNTNLVIDSVRTYNGDFTATPTGPLTLVPTETHKFVATFSPTTDGLQDGDLVFFSNSSTLRDTVSLIGNGKQPVVRYSSGTNSAGGSWINTATWSGGVVPLSTDNVVIVGGDSVYVTGGQKCNKLTVQSNGKIAINILTDSLTVLDTLKLQANATFYNGSSKNVIPGAVRALDIASTVVHRGSGVVGGPGNLEFGNLVVNRQGAGVVPAGDMIVNGNLTVEMGIGKYFRGVETTMGRRTHTVHGNVYVNQGTWSCVDIGSDSAYGTWNVDGNVFVSSTVMSNARIMPFTSADARGVGIFNIHGNLSVTGGRLSAGSNTTTTGNAFVNLGGNFTLSGSSELTASTTGLFTFNFVGTGTQTVSLGQPFTLSCNVYDTIKSTSTVVFDNSGFYWRSTSGGAFIVNGKLRISLQDTIKGAQDFSLNAGATLSVANKDGITATGAGSNGAVQVSGIKTYSALANYEYVSGDSTIATGDGLPSSVNNLTVNNPLGAKLTSPVTVNGTVSVLNGSFNLHGNKLTLGPSAVLNETSGNTCLGTIEATRTSSSGLEQNFGGIGLKLNALGTAPGVTTVTRVTGKTQTGNGHSSILRYFDIAATNKSNLNATLEFKYDLSELNGENSNTMQMWHSEDGDSLWMLQPATNNPSQYTLTATGINSLSRWTAADANNALAATLLVKVASGWNMVSVPMRVGDYRKNVLFPSAQSNAFSFENGYTRKDTLQNGPGYWLKFSANEDIPLSGVLINSDSINVKIGWNMIGSVSSPISIENVIPSPGVTIISQFYKYQNGYVTADSIVPGKSYWVKTNVAGKLYLNTLPLKVNETVNGVDDKKNEGTNPIQKERESNKHIQKESDLNKAMPKKSND